jgi:hypothetical protein
MLNRREFLAAATLAGSHVAKGQAWAKPLNETSPVSTLLSLLRREVNPYQAMQDVRTIWETDRWFAFPKFEETAKNVAAIMRRAALEDIETGRPPADGVTQYGFWTMPLAWDIKVGTLEILDPHLPADARLLADYQRVPTSIGMWSGPTPAGGVETEIIVAPPGDVEKAEFKGKLLIAPRSMKVALARAGALGMISGTRKILH